MWPEDGSWLATAEPCPSFHLDAGYAVASSVPGWLLPIGVADRQSISLPDLPQAAGHVLTADAAGHEAELIRYFAQIPPLPEQALRRETARFNSLEVNLLLCVPEQRPVLVDTFAKSRQEAGELLAILADPHALPCTLYNNLDQGWALRIVVEPDAVLVLDWNWEDPDPRSTARAYRLRRQRVAEQAQAALLRLDRLHASLVGAIGFDLWAYPGRR